MASAANVRRPGDVRAGSDPDADVLESDRLVGTLPSWASSAETSSTDWARSNGLQQIPLRGIADAFVIHLARVATPTDLL